MDWQLLLDSQLAPRPGGGAALDCFPELQQNRSEQGP